ncbi:MAG: MmgE/PrpD family protein [bacterium]
MSASPWPATRALAERIARTAAEEIDPASLGRAREAVTDTVGVTLAGASEPCARIARRLAREEGAAPRASVIGTGERTSPTWAALLNGTAGHALDFDDVDHVILGHPSVTMTPALIALAEERGLGGRALLAAYAVGFETLHALGRAVIPQHYRRGFHATATLGAVGTAAACAHLIGLGAVRTRHALSLSASGAAGLTINFGTMTKPFHAGQAARAGLLAARLAEAGFTAAEDALETGFTSALAAEGIGPGVEGFADWEGAVGQWGPPWDIAEGVCVKIHPCCAMTHTGIDAMLELCRREGIRAEEVEGIEARVSPMAMRILRYPVATTGLEGKFSMPFCLASAVVDGRVGLPQFEDDRVGRPEVAALQEGAIFEVDPELAEKDPESHTAEVGVRLRDGRRLRAREERARGDVDLPLSHEELREKFVECAEVRLTPEGAAAAWDAWWSLEAAETLDAPLALLCPADGGEAD